MPVPLHAKMTQLVKKSFNVRWGKRKMEREKKEREEFVLKNGGKMLEHMIKTFNGKRNPIRNFSEEELIMATNNYDRRNLLRLDWNFLMYEGTIESRSVLVKKFDKKRLMIEDGCDILELVTNEMAIASNMSSHNNFLKFLGCCLESEIPILVYEFGTNLSLEIINCMLWETKLRIANEIANAVAYLHYGTSRVIIHTNIEIGHVYLNQENIAKLSEFQTSVPIPFGETHVDTSLLFGTIGYLAPEVVQTRGRLTEKSDVYSIGIVLMEILIGKKLSNWLSEILDRWPWEGYYEKVLCHLKDSVLKEENRRHVIEFGELVLKCLREDPDARPTVQEVAETLKSIRHML